MTRLVISAHNSPSLTEMNTIFLFNCLGWILFNNLGRLRFRLRIFNAGEIYGFVTQRMLRWHLSMKSILNLFEAPILFDFSRGLSWVYRRFGIAPTRQLIMWPMAVAIVEVLLVAYAFNYFFTHSVGFPLYALPIMIVSRLLSIFVDYLRLRQTPKLYDANTYRKTYAEAQRNRESGIFIRVTSCFLIGGAFLIFASLAQTPLANAGLVGLGYFCLYSSIYYVRAAEPPRPDEGDFFALRSAPAS